MKRFLYVGRTATWIAATSMIIGPAWAQAPAPQAGRSAEASPPQMQTVDVALDAQRRLSGQVVDVAGNPATQTAVTLLNGKQQLHATTDAQGQFEIDGVRGGAYLARVGNQWKQVRAWAPGTAPPSANKGLMMVHGDQVVRGQAYCGSPVGCGSPVSAGFAGMREALSHPLVLGGIIAAAIAIPVAIHNSDDDDDDAS